MAMAIKVNMTPENKKFLEKWDNEEKIQKRVSLTKESLEFINQQAFEDFGLSQSSFSKEVSKLILIAKECIEKKERK